MCVCVHIHNEVDNNCEVSCVPVCKEVACPKSGWGSIATHQTKGVHYRSLITNNTVEVEAEVKAGE